jgi:putative two-component system response regulator
MQSANRVGHHTGLEQPRNHTILIVDDEPANLKLLDRMLRSQGYQQLVLVDDPREALAQYQHWRPDLVLLDINMPHLDGYQVLAQLTALEDPLLPPVVILTAQHSKDFLLRALALGAREFITKPFDRTELLMRVRNLLDARLTHRLLHHQNEHLEQLVQARTRELYHTRLQVVQRLGKAAEYRDEETGNHILRMSHICTLLARAAGWSEAQCDLILNASPLHDVGKIGIPDAILLKPGKFDAQEWAVMQQHTHIGAQLLAGDDSELMQMASSIAITHHEKWDGSGYPHGLAGAEIPMAGRIAALADVFDALTSVRPYKPAWPVADALQLLDDNRGRHFDPDLVDIFFANLEEILAIRQRFAEPAPG